MSIDSFYAKSSLNPDRSVRPAVAEDAAAIAAIQASAILESLAAGIDGDLDASVGASLDRMAMETSWRDSIEAPPAAGFQVLTSLERGTVAGFAAFVPGAPVEQIEGLNEPGTEIIALELDPAHAGEGHRSRLLAAVSDLAQEIGSKNLRTWIIAGDETKIKLFQEAGFGPAGVMRKLEVGPHRVIEHLWWAKF